MQEAFLHYIWKYKKFRHYNLKTTQGEVVELINTGEHNQGAGPDFFNARLEIEGQQWAGNVEIHLKSSDWYAHSHELDKTYDNVILHVVWEHDTDVFSKDNMPIPTLELRHFVDGELLLNYNKLAASKPKWIYCQDDFSEVDDFIINNWLERLYLERLERKCLELESLLKASKNNWEAVLFKLLSKNFGLKVNGEAFLSLANSLEWQTIAKLSSSRQQLEAVLFGQAGLLDEEILDPYYLQLQKEYRFLKHKFSLSNQGVLPIQFFRLRPLNFPTIRLAQLAAVYNNHKNVFSAIMEIKTKEMAYEFFEVSVMPFWKNHYSFKSISKTSSKHLTKQFVDLLLINTLIPFQYAFSKHIGKHIGENLLSFALSIDSEKNSIVDKFNSLKEFTKSSMHSQALIQLKTEYCDNQKCLQCAIGNFVLKGN